MATNRRITLRWAVLASITAVLVIFIGVQAVLLYRSHQQRIGDSEQWAKQQTLSIATELSQRMSDISKVADQLAEQLSSAPCSPCNTEPRLTNFYLRHSQLAALEVAFNAGQSGTDLVLYAPFIRGGSAGATIERLDGYYDYQSASAVASGHLSSNPEAWFRTAQQLERQWLAPFYERALERVIVRYTVPVLSREHQPIGLVFVDVDLKWLREQVEGYDLKDNNYLSLHDVDDRELYHSLNGAPDLTPSDLQSQSATAVNVLTHEVAWRHRQPVVGTSWFLETTITTGTRAPQHWGGASADADSVWSRPLAFLADDASVVWVAMLVAVTLLLITCLRLLRRRGEPKKLSATALSQQLPFRLMLPIKPCFFRSRR